MSYSPQGHNELDMTEHLINNNKGKKEQIRAML